MSRFFAGGAFFPRLVAPQKLVGTSIGLPFPVDSDVTVRRVTAFERKRGGNCYLKTYDPKLNGYRKRSLGFKVRDADGDLIEEAIEEEKSAAAELSNRRIKGEGNFSSTKLRRLFRIFRREVLADAGKDYTGQINRAFDFWESLLGANFRIADEFSIRHWNQAKRDRSSGRRDCRGNIIEDEDDREEVGARSVAKTLEALQRACRFGRKYRTSSGEYLLQENPVRGLEKPKNENPHRPVMSDERYETLLEKSGEHEMVNGKGNDRMRSYIREILTVVGESGRRVSAVLSLRWEDWRPDEGTYGKVRWRAEEDKIGKKWITPATPVMREALQTQRKRFLSQEWVFPAPVAAGPIRYGVARDWLYEVEEMINGLAFHGLRRRWASKRKHMSPQDVAAVGGWKSTHTLREIYQFPDEETMEEVAMAVRDLGAVQGE